MLTNRTILSGALIGVVGLALSAAILVFALSNFSVAQEVRLAGIVPSPKIVRLDHAGDSEKLSVRGYYSDQSVGDLEDGSGATVSYTSSNSSVARVDSDGVVTGIKTGGADVVVKYGNLSGTVPVFVRGMVRAIPPIDPDRLLEVGDDGSAIVLNRVVVELEPGYDSRDAVRVASDIDGEVIFEFRTFPGYIVEFDARIPEDLEKALAVLQTDRRVALAFPDLVMSSTNETLRLRDVDPDLVEAYLDAGMEEAWNTMDLVAESPSGLSPVGISVIDDGFARRTGNAVVDQVLRSEFDHARIDYTRWNVFGFVETNRTLATSKHGTAVASVIAAQNNANGIPPSFNGVVTGVDGLDYELRPYGTGILVEEKGVLKSRPLVTAVSYSLDDLSQFREQIDVVNLSMGSHCNLIQRLGFCEFIYVGLRSVWSRLMKNMPDTTFVIGAGNDAIDAKNTLPAKLSLDLPNAITIGGTDTDGSQADFSNFGPSITLAAPGEEVLVVAIRDPDGYDLWDGTSFAAPLVSGTVALLRALDPDLSPEQIRDILVATGQGKSIEVCNSTIRPCPPEKRDRWPVLDAGEAVRSTLRRSIGGEINSRAAQPTDVVLGSYVELTIPVVNTGTRSWNVKMDGVAVSPSKTVHQLDPAQNVVPAGGSHPFKLGFWANEIGEWDIGVETYGDTKRTLLFDSKQLRLQVVAATAAPVPGAPSTGQAGPPPINIPSTPGGVLQADANVLVLADTSGSMEGEKIEQLKSSVLEFIRRVDDPGEYIGLIDFDDDVGEVVPLGPFGTDPGRWNDAVERLDGDGGTAFFDAVSHAITVLETRGAPDRTNIIIALTDGNDQDSLRTASQVVSELRGASVPVILYALAYGDDASSGGDYDLAVLERLAEATGGAAYRATPEDVERLFTLLATIF